MTVTVEHPDFTLPHGICQPGTVRLQGYLLGLYGGSNLGCYNPNSKLTDGTPSFHTTGEAFDNGHDYNNLSQRAQGDAQFDWLYNHRDQLNLQQIIFGHRIWSSFHQVISNYTDTDHFNHVHTSLGRNASLNWQTSWVMQPPLPPVPPTNPVPGPTVAPVYDETEDEMLACLYYPIDKNFHTWWVDANGALQHQWNDPTNTASSQEILGKGILPALVPGTVTVKLDGNTFGMIRLRMLGQDGNLWGADYRPGPGWAFGHVHPLAA